MDKEEVAEVEEEILTPQPLQVILSHSSQIRFNSNAKRVKELWQPGRKL